MFDNLINKSDKLSNIDASFLVSPVDVYSLTTKTGDLQFGNEATFTCNVRGGRAPYKVEMKVSHSVIYLFTLFGKQALNQAHVNPYGLTVSPEDRCPEKPSLAEEFVFC